VEWADALAPADWSDPICHRHERPADSYTARIYCGRAGIVGGLGVEKLYGDTVGDVPPGGAAFRLLDSTAAVVSEMAVLPAPGAAVVTATYSCPTGTAPGTTTSYPTTSRHSSTQTERGITRG
jgi:hypothetical protein